MAADGAGNWYVADTANNRIRKVQPGGNLFTIAGNGNASYFGDGGPATTGSVNQPLGVAVDAAGNIYIADTSNHAVRRVTPDGVINTLAGNRQSGIQRRRWSCEQGAPEPAERGGGGCER